jgi:hypothetical protein
MGGSVASGAGDPPGVAAAVPRGYRGTAIAADPLMWRWLVVGAAGCTAQLDAPHLVVDPPSIQLDVDLALPAPTVTLRVLAGDEDVTEGATFSLTGAPIGSFVGRQLVSDGRTGGEATITAIAAGSSVVIPATATVHGRRLVGDAPATAPDAFAAATDVAVTGPLEPGDGAVLPPDLGSLDVDFAADDADDLHEIAVTALHLDIRVYAPGAPGPRHVALTAGEWTAIARTARGGSVGLAARSLHAGTAHRLGASLAIADLDASALAFSGVLVDAAGNPTTAPALYRYDPRAARVDPFVAAPNGGCIGCHVAISADGSRISGGGTASAGGGLVGVIVDTRAQAVLAFSEPASPWSTSAFDPSGALVTSYQAQGTLVLRDGATGAAAATLALGESGAAPAISPDGKTLAYVVIDPSTQSSVGTALHLRSWDVTTAAVGPVRELVAGTGVMAPEYSPDGAWILYARTASPLSAATQGTEAIRADGSGRPIELTAGAGDGIPRWASPVAIARAGGRDPEPMAWIAVSSGRSIGAVPLVGRQQSLWVMAFYPQRGVVSRPFYLPGQSLALSSLHAPIRLP